MHVPTLRGRVAARLDRLSCRAASLPRAWLAAAILAVAGCSPVPDLVGAETLAAESRTLLLLRPAEGTVPESEWPVSVARLRPEAVRTRPEGLYIQLSSVFAQEWGWFVPRRSDFRPAPGQDPEYAPAEAGVYSYVIRG